MKVGDLKCGLGLIHLHEFPADTMGTKSYDFSIDQQEDKRIGCKYCEHIKTLMDFDKYLNRHSNTTNGEF